MIILSQKNKFASVVKKFLEISVQRVLIIKTKLKHFKMYNSVSKGHFQKQDYFQLV